MTRQMKPEVTEEIFTKLDLSSIHFTPEISLMLLKIFFCNFKESVIS